ncbi:MAG: endonuclease V [Microscillaceae bacterium]|nr:endonuclease V [Microscillaceae bacterium]
MNQDWKANQQNLSQKIIIPTQGGYFPTQGHLILSLDIQYVGDEAYIGGDLLVWGSSEQRVFAGLAMCRVPYVPGYFCFREGPPLYQFVKYLEITQNVSVDLIIVDGHGIAHPRRFGVACWLGLACECPCIGFAKKSLIPYEKEPAEEAGSTAGIFLPNQSEVLGYVLRTQASIKPVFVSPGHLISVDNSKQVILNLVQNYRIPENMRRADQTARAYSRKETGNWVDLGRIPERVDFPNLKNLENLDS